MQVTSLVEILVTLSRVPTPLAWARCVLFNLCCRSWGHYSASASTPVDTRPAQAHNRGERAALAKGISLGLTALAVVILALGIIVGFALAGGASGPASAVPQCPGPSSQCPTPTPAPPQQREDQITIFAHGGVSSAPTVASETYTRLEGQRDSPPAFLALDPGDYPSAVFFRLDALFDAKPGISTCLRLFDVTANSPITDSEVCHGVASPPTILLRERSGSFNLLAGEHEYSVQGKCIPGANSCSGAGVLAIRIIAEWTEGPLF